MAKIALSLSGGGFRAATYHLGVLSYLSSLKTSDGKHYWIMLTPSRPYLVALLPDCG